MSGPDGDDRDEVIDELNNDIESLRSAHASEVAFYQRSLAERDVRVAELRRLVEEACDLYDNKRARYAHRSDQTRRIAEIRKEASRGV